MTFRTHQIGAFAALLTVVAYLHVGGISTATAITALIANVVGALLPDMDQVSNRLWDLLPIGHVFGKVFGKLFLGHRSLSHSLLGIFLVYKGSMWLIPNLLNRDFVNTDSVVFAMLTGYVSHMILDGLTEEGLPLLFPIRWKFGFPPWKKLRIHTGRWVEKWVVFPLLVIYSMGLTLWLGFIRL
ncbi:MAG: metal-dependent hydrolase [Candidatus Shapirobacteria bacterium]|jgi:inner membrane protein